VSFQFPPRREDDDLGPPPPPFRIQRRRGDFSGLGGYNRWVILGVLLVLLYVVLNTLKSIYVDLLWFEAVDYRPIYSKVITTQALLFAGGVLLFLAYFGSNVYYAARPALRTPAPDLADFDAAALRRVYLLAIIAGSVFLALIFGTIAANRWSTVLAFLNSEPFGITDPQFGRDIGFYVFKLPALRFFYGWLMGLAVVTALAAAGLYLFRFLVAGSDAAASRQSRVHLPLLLLAVVALFMFRYWLNRFELNFSDSGAVFGAGYTDVHARLPFIYASMAFAGVTGVALAATALGRNIMLPIAAAIVWAVVAVVGGGLYPATIQRYTVDPNELRRETPYIQRNLDLTRAAFGLDQVDERPFPAAAEVTPQEVRDNPETMNNIRLLDVRPLLDTYRQIQLIRPLYDFLDVDIDRYLVDGVRRQVMISPRELSPDRLPSEAQSWVNRHLQFTHGYGVVMSPVNEVVQEGLPNLFLQDIPVTGEFSVSRPEIYYGEMPEHYVVVKTEDREFDYPVDEGSAQNVFDGDGGVSLGSFVNRFALAWEFSDINLLISDSIRDESLILFRRNIQDRIEHIAPFLRLDEDPYLVTANGRLYWIQDAYTSTARYPYSQPSQDGFNYIRNSVKVVIDAYDGSTTFYQVDEDDPIIRTYAKIFPELLTPLSEMPAELKAHLRYPEDLFLAQVNQYRTYHIQDVVGLYNKEDIWNIPREIFDNQEVEVEPYYVIMRIPGEPVAEFALILPLTPARRENTIAWLAARSDGEDYGKLLSFRFPTNTLVFGPRQVETRINQDPTISAQFSLWNQSGSRVIRGNLLMVPIGAGNLFVEPIYLQAETSQLPELKRIVVVNGNQIAMEPTLERSIEVLFGRAPPTPPETPGTTPATPGAQPPPTGASPTPSPPAGTAADIAREADAAFQRAQAALQRGDFAAYGQEIQRVQQLIQQLLQVSGGQ
jgi:uncharacterized membrane protein (UPF0182 family)